LAGNPDDANKYDDDQADAKDQNDLRIPVEIASKDDSKQANKPQHTDGNEAGADRAAVPAHLDIQWPFCPIFRAAPLWVSCADCSGGRRNREFDVTERA